MCRLQPDRPVRRAIGDAQFQYINTQAKAFLAANEPVISVDPNYARVGIIHGFPRQREGEQQMPAPSGGLALSSNSLSVHNFDLESLEERENILGWVKAR